MPVEAVPAFAVRVAIVATALGPALPIGAILASIGRRTLSVGVIAAAAAGGIGAAVLSLLFSMGHTLIGEPGHPFLSALNGSFLGAAIPEELAKFLILSFVILRHSEAVPSRDAILAGGWIGLGFGIFENFFYVTGSEDWGSTAGLRAALSVPCHVSWGLVMGTFLKRHGDAGGPFWPVLVVPMMLHGSFNTIATYWSTLGYSVTAGTCALFAAFCTVLLCAWWLVRSTVAPELAKLDGEPINEDSMSDDAAYLWWLTGGISVAAILVSIPILVMAAIGFSYVVDIRYGALCVLAIMPLTFADLWRRA